jgi:hypothetical protein
LHGVNYRGRCAQSQYVKTDRGLQPSREIPLKTLEAAPLRKLRMLRGSRTHYR